MCDDDERDGWLEEQERTTVTAVLTIFLRVVEQVLRERAPGAAPKVRLGAVSFVHRFGSALNDTCIFTVV